MFIYQNTPSTLVIKVVPTLTCNVEPVPTSILPALVKAAFPSADDDVILTDVPAPKGNT